MKGTGQKLLALMLGSTLLAASPQAIAQSEHEKHHPASPTDSTTAMQNPGNKGGGSMSGGMQNGMGEMMNEMGKPPTKELYPSLMQLPDMSLQTHNEIKRIADERVTDGNALLAAGMEKLKAATAQHKYPAMQEAMAQIRQGQLLLQSGLEVQHALATNQPLSDVGFRWFKQNMNLEPSVGQTQPHGFFGLSWVHYVSMLTLVAFAVVVIWLYYHKMKRANALLTKLAGTSAANIPVPATASAPVTLAIRAEAPAVNEEIAPTKSNSWSGTLLVAEIFDETPNVKTYRLTDPDGGKLPFNYLPGQFITVTVAPKGVPVKRSYTIASSPTDRDYCEITVKHEEKGTVSHYLHTQVHVGELLQLTGPSGQFTFTEKEGDSVVLIAGGVGVTPMMSVIRYLTDHSWKGEMYFFYSCKNEAAIIFREEIFYLQKRHPNLKSCIILDEPPAHQEQEYVIGRISKELMGQRVPDLTSRRIHICGPKPMMEAVKQMLAELNVPKENVKTEVFPGLPPALKPKPVEPETATPAVEAVTGVVTFAKSNKTAILTPDKTILEASEDVGVNIEYSCRVGTCGICKTRLLSGKVTMEVEDALTKEDKAQNIILACQAKSTENVSVEA